MVFDSQILKLTKAINAGKSLSYVSKCCGISEKTAKKYLGLGKLPSQIISPHYWKTRRDPLEIMKGEIENYLKAESSLTAVKLFEKLQVLHPKLSPSLYRTLQRRIHDFRFQNSNTEPWQHLTGFNQEEVLLSLLAGDTSLFCNIDFTGIEEKDRCSLLSIIKTGSNKERKKAISVLTNSLCLPPATIRHFLKITDTTLRSYTHKFITNGLQALFSYASNRLIKSNDPEYRNEVFSILHSPPAIHDINRTSWRLMDIKRIIENRGKKISIVNIRQIIRKEGFNIRKAQKVLTSHDPLYQEKLKEITTFLSNLKPNESFFSIDEFGPLSVCIRGGWNYVKSGERRTIPQRQKSKGKIIITTALELTTN